MNNVRFFLLLSVVFLSTNFASAFELKTPVLPSAVSGLNAYAPSSAVQQFSKDSIKLSVAQLHEKTTLIDGYLQSSLLAVLNSLASQEQVVA